MQLDLDLAATFLVLSEERHYGRAAARLHLTSSALTKRIQRLERDLGVVLVERGPAGVLHITGAGCRFAAEIGPLLVHAAKTRAAATRRLDAYVVRIGVPAGTGNFLAGIDLSRIVHRIHHVCPEASFVQREVPFQALSDCLASGSVDVLWNSAPVRHEAIESVLLNVSSAIIGVVGSTHRLAKAASVQATTLCEEKMLYNPSLPPEWMAPFWLADIRPRQEARLVAFAATDQICVLCKTAEGQEVIAVPEILRPLLGPDLQAVDLIGASRLAFYVSRRRTDDREAVVALITALQALAPNAFATASG